MTSEEYRAFLLAGTRTGKLATVRPDGRPHVVPIWFDMDGETIVFMTGETTVKGRNMQHNPRVTLCVDEETPPYSFVMVEGTVTFSTDMDEMLHWGTRIGGRYMGVELAEAFGKRNAVPGEMLVRLTPQHVVAYAGVAD
jgi:hypothetical protein